MQLLYNPWLEDLAVIIKKTKKDFSLLEYKDGTRFESYDKLITLLGWEIVGEYD